MSSGAPSTPLPPLSAAATHRPSAPADRSAAWYAARARSQDVKIDVLVLDPDEPLGGRLALLPAEAAAGHRLLDTIEGESAPARERPAAEPVRATPAARNRARNRQASSASTIATIAAAMNQAFPTAPGRSLHSCSVYRNHDQRSRSGSNTDAWSRSCITHDDGVGSKTVQAPSSRRHPGMGIP